ncbi:hypothetical protein AMS68_007721 [Peltaster fructicola]|uniref:BHLH domain-containing protein n=1 Tax=Peltaster fructicola TaxID=286661 RepID=A0A6H0Y5B7_9PEZI|nr:hypothetical protein AMS68_007721 [Peltaster fructicola]
MPRPAAPPTPGSSSDIRGKEGSYAGPSFTLPPSGFLEDRASASSSPSNNGSDSSYHPISPGSLAAKRPATTGVITKDDFALPPPPTRSRKIIQMKPKDNEQAEAALTPTESPQITAKAAATSQASAAGKKKQTGAATTAAGRKIARKTAHSLIERRRRSKMNEEFGVLKDMIPACKGQEMHKLAILQASIEYLRYLEQCVQDLQSQKSPSQLQAPTAPRVAPTHDEEDEDEEMEDDQEEEASTPATGALEQSNSVISLPSLSQITSASTSSPSIFGTGAGRQYSISSASQASYSPYFHSNQPSPAFGPQLHHVSTAPSYASAFGIGSPALHPIDQLRQIADGVTELSEKQQRPATKAGRHEQDLDHEATAALLMLNNDRRQWRTVQQENEERRSTNGMSVKDLLSG